MTIEQLKNVLGKPDFSQEGKSFEYSSLGITVVTRDTKTVDTIFCGDMSGTDVLKIKSCKYHTAEGIGMGSSEAQIIKAYGEPTKKTYTESDRKLRLKYGPGLGFMLIKDEVTGIFVRKVH